jgi:hypothetical protein
MAGNIRLDRPEECATTAPFADDTCRMLVSSSAPVPE